MQFEEEGNLAGGTTLKQYLCHREGKWVSAVGFFGWGVIVLDTEIYDDART